MLSDAPVKIIKDTGNAILVSEEVWRGMTETLSLPEELNRKIVDHLSDINLVLTEHARRYLLAEGIRAETIIKTGSHKREILDFYAPEFKCSDTLGLSGPFDCLDES